jgi:hypothetical protein
MQLAADSEATLSKSELGALLRDCLSSSVRDYLRSAGNGLEYSADTPSENAAIDITLADLFQDASPSIGLLIAVKRTARRQMNEGAGDLPADIHHAIYFASIAAALVRCGERISKSSDEVLRVGFERAVGGLHAEYRLRGLLTTAAGLLNQ